MYRYGVDNRKLGLMLAIAALAFLTHPILLRAADGDSFTETTSLKVDRPPSPLPALQDKTSLCNQAVTVCAREMQPLGVEVGGTFTIKIEEHYTSTYVCKMINGVPTWISTETQGSCEPQPVITLPAQYDEDEAWNVG